MATEDEFRRTEENLNSVTDFIANCEYAGRTIDERHERIADRHYRNCDSTLNGMLGAAEFQREVIQRLPFREAQ